MFEVSVIVEPVNGTGFRASCGAPLSASAEGVSREEALERLRAQLEGRFQHGAEVVRMRIGDRAIPATPVWPDDDLTQTWLQGIADARAAADRRPDSWDVP